MCVCSCVFSDHEYMGPKLRVKFEKKYQFLQVLKWDNHHQLCVCVREREREREKERGEERERERERERRERESLIGLGNAPLIAHFLYPGFKTLPANV